MQSPVAGPLSLHQSFRTTFGRVSTSAKKLTRQFSANYGSIATLVFSTRFLEESFAQIPGTSPLATIPFAGPTTRTVLYVTAIPPPVHNTILLVCNLGS